MRNGQLFVDRGRIRNHSPIRRPTAFCQLNLHPSSLPPYPCHFHPTAKPQAGMRIGLASITYPTAFPQARRAPAWLRQRIPPRSRRRERASAWLRLTYVGFRNSACRIADVTLPPAASLRKPECDRTRKRFRRRGVTPAILQAQTSSIHLGLAEAKPERAPPAETRWDGYDGEVVTASATSSPHYRKRYLTSRTPHSSQVEQPKALKTPGCRSRARRPLSILPQSTTGAMIDWPPYEIST